MDRSEIIFLLKSIRKRGLRITKLREAMVKILARSTVPLSVADMLKALKRMGISPNKTSVYREMEILRKENFVREVRLGENKKRYELSVGSHHHHLVCVGCGDVEKIEMEKDLEQSEVKIAREKNFLVLEHSLEFFGKCAKC